MEGKMYICESCGGRFKSYSDWSDEQANEEFVKNFPNMQDAPVAVVCDDCYKEFLERFPPSKEN